MCYGKDALRPGLNIFFPVQEHAWLSSIAISPSKQQSIQTDGPGQQGYDEWWGNPGENGRQDAAERGYLTFEFSVIPLRTTASHRF